MGFKIGDKIRSKNRNPVGEIVEIKAGGIAVVEWPSGMRAHLIDPDSFENVEEVRDAINSKLVMLRKIDEALIDQIKALMQQRYNALEGIIRDLL
jgi:hypothetical protein